MKKLIFFTVAIASLIASIPAQAQWNRKNYINLSWVDQTLESKDLKTKNGENMKWESEYGFSFVKGTTYYLHRKPIFGLFKFGIDWTQIDLNYAKLKPCFENDAVVSNDFSSQIDEELDLGQHQMEYSMHIGASLTINPVDHLKINGYFRYAPSFSGVLCEDEEGDSKFSGGFASFFVAVGAISYKVISFGLESRWGEGKYKTFTPLDEGMNSTEIISSNKEKLKTNSTRFYLSFRF